MSKNCYIEFSNVSLLYELNYHGVSSLKERLLNIVLRRKVPTLQHPTLYALDDVSVKINHGERVGIIGLNGSGKSTFLKVASGILRPQRGDVSVVGNVQPLIEIGAGFNPEFSGRENIYLNGAMLGFSPAQIKEREKEIIEFSELEEFIDVPVKYYSSGMAVRLAFTIATIIQPEILLMDEMLAAGDLLFIEKAKNRIDKILTKAKILVLVSHDLGLIESLCDRCIVLASGRVVFDGKTALALEFYRNRAIEKIEHQKKMEAEEPVHVPVVDEDEGEKSLEKLVLQVGSGNSEVRPDGEANFLIKFHLPLGAQEVFVNLSINNRLGLQKLHLRNDFNGIRISDCETGEISVRINIPNFPLKSDKYSCQARVVITINDRKEIFDSNIESLNVLGEMSRDSLIKNEWSIEGKCKLSEI